MRKFNTVFVCHRASEAGSGDKRTARWPGQEAKVTLAEAMDRIRRLETGQELLRRALSMALVAPCEIHMRLEPCPAMKLAEKMADEVMKSLPGFVNELDRLIEEHERLVRGSE